MERMLGGLPAQLLNRFVFVPDAHLSMSDDELPVQDAVMFIYIDHECGTTASLVSRARKRGGKVELYEERYFVPGCRSMQIFRYGAFPLAGVVLLSDAETCELGLALLLGIDEIYGFRDHDWQRQDERLDPFRHDAFPDDVLAILPTEDEVAERVWVRLERPFPRQKFEGFAGTLLNQPCSASSYVSAGDAVVLRLLDSNEEALLVLVGKIAEE